MIGSAVLLCIALWLQILVRQAEKDGITNFIASAMKQKTWFS
jgi:hypothetical protein